MPRIASVGAGSTVFTRHLIGDVLAQPELAGSTFALMDVDPARLETSRAAARELVAPTARTRPSRPRSTAARRWRAPTSSSPASRSAAWNRR